MTPPEVERRETTGIVLAWIGLLLAGTLCGVGALVLDTGILWAQSTGCEPGPAKPDDVLVGQLSMAVVLVAATATWTLAWFVFRRRRRAVVVSALLAVGPALGYLVYGLDSHSWVGGFCIQF